MKCYGEGSSAQDPPHLFVQCDRAGTCGANAHARSHAGAIAHRSRKSRERPRPSTREFLVPCEEDLYKCVTNQPGAAPFLITFASVSYQVVFHDILSVFH